jgi:two-component system phosphate regulon sensor histidine kinase PhoR
LQTAHERLLALARLRDEFVANVSHELRTPIASLKLYHHLLGVRPDKRDSYLSTLHRETERLEHIVEDLLYLSRLDREQVALKLSPIDLNALISAYVTDRSPLADERGLKLTFHGRRLPDLLADRTLLERVLSILLTNAISYTPAGGRVQVETHTRRSEGQRWVGFSVSDNGLGIPPDEQPRLFERFFRGKASRDTGTPGTGLGLATAREIVERHAGRIEAESEGIPGRGATFTVWLPAAGARLPRPD